MKYFQSLFLALACVALFNGCANQNHLIQSNLWVQNAAEYRALTLQAYNMAQFRLDQKLRAVRYTKTPCIVLDLDETCLDNSPYTGYQIKKNKSYTSESWQSWTSLAAADSIPGSVSFLNWAKAQPCEIFYISNRKVAELDATIENMKALNFPNADKDHVLLRSAESDKTARRALVEENHTIVMYFGDNLNDFSNIWEEQLPEDRHRLVDENKAKFGVDYIIIPNPNYGSWQSAMFDYKRGLKAGEQKKVRMKNTLSFE